MSTANVTNNLIDHMAIMDLLNRYTNAVNHREWTALEACFSTEGIWDMGGPAIGPGAMYFEGAHNIATGIANAVNSAELCFQANHAPVIEVNGERATARSTIHETVRPIGGGGMVIFGIYYDEAQFPYHLHGSIAIIWTAARDISAHRHLTLSNAKILIPRTCRFIFLHEPTVATLHTCGFQHESRSKRAV
jgi:SnoaL-like domain